MAPLVSFKSRLRGIICCCDPHDTTPCRKKYPSEKYPSGPRPSQDPFGFNSRPTSTPPSTQATRWSRGHANASGDRQQRNNDFAPERCDIVSENILRSVFTYDIKLLGQPGDKPVYRRLLLDFDGNQDALSDDIAQLLNLDITPCYDELCLPNGSVAKAKGEIVVKWQLYKGRRQHKTKLLVIPNSPFDMVLGVSSIRRYKLWKEDRSIRTELKYHTNEQGV